MKKIDDWNGSPFAVEFTNISNNDRVTRGFKLDDGVFKWCLITRLGNNPRMPYRKSSPWRTSGSKEFKSINFFKSYLKSKNPKILLFSEE